MQWKHLNVPEKITFIQDLTAGSYHWLTHQVIHRPRQNVYMSLLLSNIHTISNASNAFWRITGTSPSTCNVGNYKKIILQVSEFIFHLHNCFNGCKLRNVCVVITSPSILTEHVRDIFFSEAVFILFDRIRKHCFIFERGVNPQQS